MHFSVFLYQYITLLASLIYFWRGDLETPKTPLDPPLIWSSYIATYLFHLRILQCFNVFLTLFKLYMMKWRPTYVYLHNCVPTVTIYSDVAVYGNVYSYTSAVATVMLFKMSSRVFTNVWCLLITMLHGDDDVPSISAYKIYILSHMCTCTHTHPCMYTHAHTHAHTHTHTHTHTHMQCYLV